MSGRHVTIASVRLKNFLSFYEGLVVLDPGLNVILGPNGSGKTSVFHAVKFALGSNQRENRYAKWSDFIRHGASMAEVEVTLMVDGKATRFLRKIDRDGIPRAYMDGRRIKAAEHRVIVQALGLDVDNTLVFMPQERINALRDLNPLEVRKLVEEGTGLAALRDRIAAQEVEVALDRQRLESAVSESELVKRELDLLQKDLERLQKKRELQREERALGIEVRWASLEDVRQRASTVRSEMAEREAGLVSLDAEHKAVGEQVAAAERATAALETKAEELQMELGKIDARLQEEELKLQRLQDDSKKAVVEVRQLEKDVVSAKRRREKTSQDLVRASKAKEQYEESVRLLRAQTEELEKERAEIDAKLEAFAEWNARRAQAHGVYRSLQAEAEGKEVLLRSLNERLQNEQAEYQSIQTRWGNIWSTLESMDEKELVKKKGHLEARLAALNEERFRETSRASQIQKEVEELRGRISESSRRIPDTVRQLREAIDEHKIGSAAGPLIALVGQESQYSAALEGVLFNDLAFAFIVKDSADFSLLEKLRNNLESPSPLILVSQDVVLQERPVLPPAKGVLGWLWDLVGLDAPTTDMFRRAIGDFVLVSDYRTASRLAQKEGLSAVTLSGQVVLREGGRTVSHPARTPTGVLSTAPLQSRLSRALKELEAANKKVTELVTQSEQVTREREAVLDLISQITRWSGTWERRKQLLDSIPQLEERVAAVDDELKSLQQRLGKAERDLRSLDASQPPERSRLVGELSAVRMKQRGVQSDLSKAEEALSSAERDEVTLRSELRSIDETVTALSDRLEELREELRSSKDTASLIHQTIETLRDGREATKNAHQEVKLQIQRSRETAKVLTSRLVELSLSMRERRQQANQARRQLNALEQEARELEDSLKGEPRPDRVRALATVRDELVRVRHRLDEYHDVTEAVAQTESELKGRLQGLAARVAELREELSAAETAVMNIRSQYHHGMYDILSRVEAEVNRVLSIVSFAASVRFELVETDGEYGVEFKTRIKSDQFSKISAGSGGERSLIAIALILALQRFSAAPVYALDEIDIFLDATNTEMVSMLLHDSSRRSQFILFTPAKSTHLLKHADRRIGIVAPRGTEPSVVIESPEFAVQ
ncbi:MAG: chromosome segregation protein SMC [Candidatus Thorarchaeota archaeon]|nr:chromosome segregation protein SMC [Candidatus Thorarchaeota archaeon]